MIESIEIGSCPDIDIKNSGYLIGDFIEEIIATYKTVVEQGFDSIVLVIDTDADETYYINDAVNGFQCDSFDYYFDDLASIAEELFNEIQGNVTEIRIE